MDIMLNCTAVSSYATNRLTFYGDVRFAGAYDVICGIMSFINGGILCTIELLIGKMTEEAVGRGNKNNEVLYGTIRSQRG